MVAGVLSSRLTAVGTFTLLSGATLAGEFFSVANLSLVSRMMLPASLLQVACTVPNSPPLVRFFPAVTGVPYLLCVVAAGFALRSSRGLPEARDAAEALGTVLLLGGQVALISRMVIEIRRSGFGRGVWRLPVTLSGAALSLAGYVLWLSFEDSGFAIIAFGLLPACILPWTFASSAWRRSRVVTDVAATSTPLEEIARRIAHAILKPVTAVSEQLRVVAPTIDDVSTRAVLENASQLMGQVQRLVRDLLDLGRAQAEPDRRLLNLGKLIEQAIAELRDRHPGADVEMEPSSGDLIADELGLRCLLINLLENAAEARPPGWIRVRSEWLEGWLQIVIEDRSGGVAQEVRDRMFEPFVTTKERGTGLGLAVVREVLRAHGGHASFQLTARGTRFVVTLPRDS